MNFHCPTCARKSSVLVKCRLEAELKAKKDAELRAKAKLERDRLERGQADELAGAMNEFFTALYTDNADSTTPDMSMYMTSSFTDLPLSSPDSITVTTEFGVLEETGNVTIISAGGATHPYDTQNEDDEEYDDDLQYEDMEPESGPESYVIMTEDTSAVHPHSHTDWVTAVALQHQQQSTSLLQQQMQNMYNVTLSTNSTPPLQQQISNMYNVALNTNSTPPLLYVPTPAELALVQEAELASEADMTHEPEFDGALLSDEDETDAGDDADVDTDEINESADDIEADGAMTPTAAQLHTQS